jgi:5-methylcytosine-specific restriction protein A
MATIILMWNPGAWTWHELPEKALSLRAGEPCEERWSIGRTKNIAIGSRAYILRVGGDRYGFVASGWVAESPTSHPHWDAVRAAAGERTNYVAVSLDVLLNPEFESPMNWRLQGSTQLKNALQHLQGSGKSIPGSAAMELEVLWERRVGQGQSIGRSSQEPEAREGAITWRLVKHRSRERSLRHAKIKAALQEGKLRCEVPGCGFDFARQYGDIGRGFAHVHHLKPLATLDGEQSVSLGDLAIICANCHAMVHHGGECRSLETLVSASARAEP